MKKWNTCGPNTLGDCTVYEDGEIVAELVGEDYVNLIVAAPEMYEALNLIVRRLQVDIDDGGRPDEWSMRALVRKASKATEKALGKNYDN